MAFRRLRLKCFLSLPASSIPQKWDELRRKVLNIQPMLPSGSSVPIVSDDFGDVFGIYYGLTADDGFSYEEDAQLGRTDQDTGCYGRWCYESGTVWHTNRSHQHLYFGKQAGRYGY